MIARYDFNHIFHISPVINVFSMLQPGGAGRHPGVYDVQQGERVVLSQLRLRLADPGPRAQSRGGAPRHPLRLCVPALREGVQDQTLLARPCLRLAQGQAVGLGATRARGSLLS